MQLLTACRQGYFCSAQLRHIDRRSTGVMAFTMYGPCNTEGRRRRGTKPTFFMQHTLFLRNTLAARLAPIFSAYWGALFSLGCKTTILETAKACSLLEWRRMSCSGIESWVHNRPKPTGVLYEAVKHIAKFCENNPGLMGKRVQDLRVKSVLLNAIQKSRAEVALECSFMQ